MTSMNDLLFAVEPILRYFFVLSPVLFFLGYQIAKLERQNSILSWRVESMQFEVKILKEKERYQNTRIDHLVGLVQAMNKYDIGEDYETLVKRLKQEER